MTDENKQIILAGDVYIDRFTDQGVATGLIGPLNTDALTITQAIEEKTQTSRMKTTFGQTRASVNMPSPPTIKIGFQDQPAEIFAMALLGDVSTLTEGAQTVTDEPITVVEGKWVDLAYRNLTAASVGVDDVTDTTTYVEGTDYEINYAYGLIRAITGGAIADGDVVHVDYGTTALSGERITGATRPNVTCRIVLDGRNLATGKDVHFEAWQCSIGPDGEVDLNSGEFITTSLTGTMVTPSGKASPFVLDDIA